MAYIELNRCAVHTLRNLDRVVAKARAQAKAAGLTRSDIAAVTAEVGKKR